MEDETKSHVTARDLKTLRRALQNVPQRRQCAKCGDTSKLECPKCPSGQVCQYTVPADCTQCAQTVCMVDDSPQASSNGNGGGGGNGKGGGGNGPSAAPIAGGVIGGIIVIASLTYLVWRFLIRPKRSRISPSIYDSSAKNARDVEKDNASRFTHRSSTHTVHSIASTVLTRASNIIQIAYIPGVTNRATPTSPSVLVPPVPPIPMHHTEANRSSNQDEQHFFVPGNLRDSTYSGISEFSDRTSYAHRSSIASTIYGRQAQVQTPAQTGMRAKPTVVSVKSGGNGSFTPPVPSIDFDKFGGGRPKSVTSTFSVGSTIVNNANTATQARAQVVKLGGGPRKIDVGARSEANSSSLSLGSTASQVSPTQPGARTPDAAAPAGDLGMGDQGPFSDPPSTPKPAASARTLGAVMEDEGEEHRDEGRRSRGPGSIERGRSPFGDEHATK
ncbi:opy2 protein [Hirsutella rhossiliensis]|uniref:Opy2 protein n=1 Tax=Hirsutella rhossiliensis TaxID=111463 RepID=A0A9P8MPR6_9HYPO|nr:opy2 protein [Hirsutella rhossiliensis]KAH0959483.1 opy2 protein [Hirsutella rhossiliensis]